MNPFNLDQQIIAIKKTVGAEFINVYIISTEITTQSQLKFTYITGDGELYREFYKDFQNIKILSLLEQSQIFEEKFSKYMDLPQHLIRKEIKNK